MIDNGVHVCETTTGMSDDAFSVLLKLKNTIEERNKKNCIDRFKKKIK